jgi:hypothetical protein
MMGFRDAIGEFGRAGRRVVPVLAPSRLAAIVNALPVPQSHTVHSTEELGDLQSRLAQRYDSVRIEGLSLREFREIPSAFWHGPRPLDEHGSLFSHFLSRLRYDRRKSAMRGFVDAFLSRYPLGSPTFSGAAEFIAGEISHFESRYLALATEWQAFAGTTGAQKLGAEVLTAGPTVLERVGMSEHLWTFQFVEEVFRDACRQLDPTKVEQLENVRAFAERPAVSRAEALRFPGSRGVLFEGLLGRWRDKPPPPESAAKRALMAFIDRIAGDPRGSASEWTGVDDALKKIYLRWLASASLKQFLDIVERSLRGSADGSRMWPDRRRFWTAWFQMGHIDEAWVAFGPSAYDDARRASARDASFGTNYAKVEASRSGYHSALIMKIGDHTVVEWSHSGKCWIWPDSKKAPRIGAKRYHDNELREAPLEFVHREGWQHQVNVQIRKLTGLRLRTSDWT